MTLFSMSGKLMGTLGLMCVNSNQEISMEASEALHYLFKILALQRGKPPDCSCGDPLSNKSQQQAMLSVCPCSGSTLLSTQEWERSTFPHVQEQWLRVDHIESPATFSLHSPAWC
ncbi:Hypothetical predicted protein [Marmota monax]|uniref:Maestro-like HEAT-repeats domain-containing protein n=1 Tax=Marmota monax TaxID=9995 RepID=A0A5E4AHR2_MARMO|nr:Hypothetical predicted protein [Marmota monax]